MPESLSEHKLNLAKELLDDIELSRLPATSILLKASRLARVLEDDQIAQWLRWELRGYPSNNQLAAVFLLRTNRMTDTEQGTFYAQPLAEIDGHLAALQTQLSQMRVPDVNYSPSSANPNEFVAGLFGGGNALTQPVTSVLGAALGLRQEIGKLSGIRSRVLSLLHDFAAASYYRLAFSGLATSIFDRYKSMVDDRLRSIGSDVFERVPAISDRLAEGDPEAVSQALNTLRRLIKAVANVEYPAHDGVVAIGGQQVEVGPIHYLNRLGAYIEAECPSDTRRKRLRQSLRALNDRASAGVHDDVGLDEARALLLQAYLTLGEILLLRPPPSAGVS
jgi:hypothetical protein